MTVRLASHSKRAINAPNILGVGIRTPLNVYTSHGAMVALLVGEAGEHVMAEPFIGQICSFGFNFAPQGWANCAGQTMPINQNETLFTLLGTTFGGDGQTTYGLPDLRGRTSLNQGTGPGLSTYSMGEIAGTESVTLTSNQLPSHTHSAGTSNTAGSTNVPATNVYLSTEGPGTPIVSTYVPNTPATQTAISASTISVSGNNNPHENRQSYLVTNYCIALVGIFPSRN